MPARIACWAPRYWPPGPELVHTYIDLVNADVPYTVMRDAVHIHPTLSEAVQSVLGEL